MLSVSAALRVTVGTICLQTVDVEYDPQVQHGATCRLAGAIQGLTVVTPPAASTRLSRDEGQPEAAKAAGSRWTSIAVAPAAWFTPRSRIATGRR